jgi:hypothetical protein
MDLTKELAKLTREELYEKVWSTPCSRLAKEFGLSDVAIAKRCKKLAVPSPSRGYWARLQAGLKPRRVPLPPTAEEAFARLAEKKPLRSKLPRPDEASLAPMAAEFLAALKKCKSKWESRIHLKEPTLPEATVSPALAERCAQAFHVILLGTEAVGLAFRKSRSSYEGGLFRMGRDQLFFAIEEELVTAPVSSSARGRRPAYSAYGDNRVPCGSLSFRIKDSRYGATVDLSWAEGKDGNLESVLVKVVGGIRSYFVQAQKKRAQAAIDHERQRLEWEEQHREYEKKQAMEEAAQRRQKHAKAVRKIVRTRRENLLKAAEWWRLHRVALEFIADCEGRWMAAQNGQLEPNQESWLSWARETASTLSPSACGYPDPANDGLLDMGSVPFGGPYPETSKFTRPPTMPKIPAPTIVKQGYGEMTPTPQPYPFWLKNQRW